MTIAIALLIASIIPVGFLILVRRIDKYQAENFNLIIVAGGWGVFAYIIAAQINPAMIDAGIINYDNMVRFSAPILEEILKAIILLFLVRQVNFTYFVDGAIFGFAAGIGFAIIENVEYVTGNPETALIQAIGRVLSTNLMHATGSGIIGVTLGLSRFDRTGRKALSVLTGVTLSMILHVAFNNLVTRVSSGLLLIYAIGVGFTGAGFIAYMVKRGFKNEEAEIKDRLKKEKGITEQEATAVEKVDQMKQYLAPIAEKFGHKKAEQAKVFLLKQAKISRVRKNLTSYTELGDEKMIRATENQIKTLQEEVDELRRDVGTYCMLFLRNTFMQETSPLWGRLESLIEEQAMAPKNPNGPSLWGSLNTKIKPEK